MKTKSHRHEDPTASVRLKEMAGVLRRNDIIHGPSPEKLRSILEELGPTYVKIGQIMSMRSDVLPASYCQELMKLRADVKPIPFEEIKAVIDEEFGKRAEDLFESIDEEPLGSASIAQVHAVTLHDGRKAVVKVQRPGIFAVMQQDIKLLGKAVKLIRKMELSGDVIDFNKVLDEMWNVAQEEMNFQLEADNCTRITVLNENVKYVAFPEIVEELTTSRILTMEYIEGIPVDEIEHLEKHGYDLNEIGLKLASNYIKQILKDGFFHADPHPGNIWIREGKIIWLDLGMVGHLNEKDRTLFKKGVQAIVDKDVFEVKNVLLQLGKIKGSINHARLYSDIESLLNKYGDLDFSGINLGEMLQEIVELCNKNDISTPSRITMLARGIVTIEGILAKICPDVSFIEVASNYLAEHFLEEMDLRQELRNNSKKLYNIGKKTIEIPGYISDLLKMFVKGQAKINLDVTGAEEPIRQVDYMVDKLIISIIAAALLIGSSLISTTDMQPQVLDIPVFGILGFLGATCLSVWLLYGIIKRRRRMK